MQQQIGRSEVMKEEWRDIKGYEGLYQVSNFGKVRSDKGNLKAQFKNRQGYFRVQLYKNNKGKHFSVHRLVALAFIPNAENKPQVNHIDENKENNIFTNLEWVTQSENHNHGTINERISQSLKNNPKKSKPVAAFDDFGNLVFAFPSIYEAERQTGINNCSIRACLHKRKGIKKAGGYKWEYQ